MSRALRLLVVAAVLACKGDGGGPVGPDPSLTGRWSGSARVGLLDFEATNPSTILSSTSITGLAAGETVVAVDIRPATGQLFAVGVGLGHGHLYTINPSNGDAALVNDAPFSESLPTGGRWSLDFDPVLDRARLVHTSGANYTLNPVNGKLASVDSPIGPATPSAIVIDQ